MRDIGEYLKLIYSFSATITKLRKADITLECGVTINTAAISARGKELTRTVSKWNEGRAQLLRIKSL